MVGQSESTGDSVAERAARRADRDEARAARTAEREAARSRESASSDYQDLDGQRDDGDRNVRGARLGVLAGSAAVIGGGLGGGLYEHQQFQKFETTYLAVWPECATQCVEEGVAYYNAYVWPHQVKRLVGFGISGAGLVGLGLGMLVTSPTQVTLLPTMGGLEIGVSGRF